MSLLNKVLGAAVLVFAAQTASAASVTIGSFTFDDSQLATNATVTMGAVNNVERLYDHDFNTYSEGLGGGDEVRVDFGYDIVNGSGYDFLVFENVAREVMNVSLTSGGPKILGTWIETNGSVHTFGFNLDDFGVGASVNVGSSIFLSQGNTSAPDVSEAAVLNTAATQVPLPAGGMLLMSSLIGFGILRRRRKS